MPKYAISYRREADADLAFYGRRVEVMVTDAVDTHLTDQPVPVPGREGQRRRMAPNPLEVEYRLRVGDYRVYYNVDEENAEVDVVRIGHKPGETVTFRGRPSPMRD